MNLVRLRMYLGLFAFLFVLSAYATLYTWKAYDTASHVILYEPYLSGPHWPSAGYSLFPFPHMPSDSPGFSYIQVHKPLSPTDFLIYEHLVKTQLLVAITALLWILAALFGTYVLRIGSTLLGNWTIVHRQSKVITARLARNVDCLS